MRTKDTLKTGKVRVELRVYLQRPRQSRQKTQKGFVISGAGRASVTTL